MVNDCRQTRDWGLDVRQLMCTAGERRRGEDDASGDRDAEME